MTAIRQKQVHVPICELSPMPPPLTNIKHLRVFLVVSIEEWFCSYIFIPESEMEIDFITPDPVSEKVC